MLIDRALNTVQMAGAQYADIRIVDTLTESIRVKNGVVESLNTSESIGFGIRVLVGVGLGTDVDVGVTLGVGARWWATTWVQCSMRPSRPLTQ